MKHKASVSVLMPVGGQQSPGVTTFSFSSQHLLSTMSLSGGQPQPGAGTWESRDRDLGREMSGPGIGVTPFCYSTAPGVRTLSSDS